MASLGLIYPLDWQALCNHNDSIDMFDEVTAMPALTIKNIPDDLYNELKIIAEQHHRSINSEVIMCLKRSLFPQKVPPEDRLSEIRALRTQITPNAFTDEEIERAINEGRP